MTLIPRSVGTHNGSFHADEVTACSLLLLFGKIDRERIFRTRDPEIHATCEYLCDVGGEYDPKKKRFDHHQAQYRGPLSSAGMVLAYLYEHGSISKELTDYFNHSLIIGVDAYDNGAVTPEIGMTSFSQVIANFLPVEYEVSEEAMNQAFDLALDFVVAYLSRLKKRYEYILQCKAVVREKMTDSSYVMTFDAAIPWMDAFFELQGELHPAQFIIMPSGSHWKLRGIPPTLKERMKVRRPLLEEWAGLQGEALEKVCGIPGAVFCHKGLFISIWKTKDAALHAAHKILERK